MLVFLENQPRKWFYPEIVYSKIKSNYCELFFKRKQSLVLFYCQLDSFYYEKF